MKITRRQLFAAAGAALLPRREPIRVISKQPEHYCGWPTLARTRKGRLLLVYSGGREEHVCPFGRVEMMHSDDGGKTWTWPRVLLDSAIDDRDAGVLETPKGTLLVTTFTSLAYERSFRMTKPLPEAKLRRWRAVHDRMTAEERKKDLGVWMIRSTDGGATWSGRVDCGVNSPHGPVALSDGRLLYAGKELWSDTRRIGVRVSNDDGKTWAWLAEIPARPGDDPRNYHELHAVEAKGGRILAQIRNHNAKNSRETLQTESTDGGKTWSVPRAIGVWGLPSHLLRLRDGRLLMSTGYRRKPYGNQARLSEDSGRTWSAPLTISDDGAGGDLGYPSTVELDGGRLVTVWYERPRDSSKAVLRQATWTLPS